MKKIGFIFIIFLVFSSCANVFFIGSTHDNSTYKVCNENAVSPAQAMEKAKPHLPFTWELRCKYIHKNQSSNWCNKKTYDYIVQKGDYYYITRTSYPYKTYYAYIRYAVKVHVQTGKMILPADGEE